MLIELARPKKVYITVKLSSIMHVRRGLRGEMLEIDFSGKIIAFLSVLLPKFLDLVAVITEECDFNTSYCNSKFYDSNKGENGDLKSYLFSNIC